MGDHVERKGTTAFQTPKPVNCDYGTNFKLMLIRRAEETNSFTAAWEILSAVEQNVQCSGKQKYLLLKDTNST